ncbi:hypothetical protein EZ428_18120 [Pedobacter frigiditerrae]|uniref:Uncharacterized protein n=1 Tax=Pedobacter frigiditerrae TaxID=2530452 RepID=A0A4R0MPU7_9SPHI|nr:hypothetical protein [Pedobacter frigiditerrae]TCC88557.1 hypothetical protein EZ428_18120 [Pedobacter frigiditerrae]
MIIFKCRYVLENIYVDIIEVKRPNLSDDAPFSEKFLWLKIEKEALTVTPLTLRSVDSSGEVEERYFEEGFLKFNNTIGTFIEKYNSAQHLLQYNDCLEVSEQTKNAIMDYFAQRINA